MELPSKYSREHYQRKTGRYAFVLRSLFNVRVDQTTRQRWRDLIAFGRAIDTFLDEGNKATLKQRAAVITTMLDEPREVADQFPSLSIDQLGKKTYGHLQQLGNAILDVNLQYKATTSLSHYALLRRVEGRLYADLISSVATTEVANQDGYDRFSRWLRPTGEVTNLVNSFTDIYRDYAHGEIALVPNLLTRPQLIGHLALALMDARHTANTTVLTDQQITEIK